MTAISIPKTLVKGGVINSEAVERAGMRGLDEGQAIAYDLETDQRSGKVSAANLRAA